MSSQSGKQSGSKRKKPRHRQMQKQTFQQIKMPFDSALFDPQKTAELAASVQKHKLPSAGKSQSATSNKAKD